MEGIVVIAAYRPKVAMEQELEKLVVAHHGYLAKLELVTERKPVLMKSQDGTVIEVFEWKSQEAIDRAHQLSEVHKMWNAFEKVCDYIPLEQLPEGSKLFASFRPIDPNKP